jgi:hypothetical protein
MLWCAAIQLVWPILSFCLSFSILSITNVNDYVAFSVFTSLGATLTSLTWCVMAWKSNFVRKLAMSVFALALLPNIQALLGLSGLLPETAYPIHNVTVPVLSILGPIYLAVLFRKFDFRFPVWPLVLIAVAHPVFVVLKAIELPRDMLGYKMMMTSGIPMLLNMAGWAAVLVCLKISRPSHKDIVMLR